MVFPKIIELDQLIKKSSVDLSDTLLLSSVHLMASNGSLFECLQTANLRYTDMYLIGKEYSTNQEVVDELRLRGTHVTVVTLGSTDLGSDYRALLAKEIESVLLTIRRRIVSDPKVKRLLILDDGGVIIQSVSKFNFQKDGLQICGVEQTSNGIRYTEQSTVEFPVVNVARSKQKLINESPLIAESFIQFLSQRLRQFGQMALIIGNGSIGSHIKSRLTDSGVVVKAYDIDRNLSEFSSYQHMLRYACTADLIVGVSGQSVLTNQLFENLKDEVILASASSSNVEFLNEQISYELSPDKTNSLIIRYPRGTATILNKGFPINFDGSLDPIPVEKIKITRILMLQGAIKSLNSDTTGIVQF